MSISVPRAISRLQRHVNQPLSWSFLVSMEYFLAFMPGSRGISLQFVGSQQDVSTRRIKKRKQLDDATAATGAKVFWFFPAE